MWEWLAPLAVNTPLAHTIKQATPTSLLHLAVATQASAVVILGTQVHLAVATLGIQAGLAVATLGTQVHLAVATLGSPPTQANPNLISLGTLLVLLINALSTIALQLV